LLTFLVVPQFTQVLDILQTVLRHHDIKYLLLTGATAVDVRQAIVDEFTEDESIPVFLLSTKAGGMGINLAAASVVIMSALTRELSSSMSDYYCYFLSSF